MSTFENADFDTILANIVYDSRVQSPDCDVIESIEVENVQKAIKELTGDEMSKGDILTAASSEIFETQSLERALGKASRKLDPEDVATILGCLSDLIRADGSIRYQELEFFDRVATALKASPSEIAGLYEK